MLTLATSAAVDKSCLFTRLHMQTPTYTRQRSCSHPLKWDFVLQHRSSLVQNLLVWNSFLGNLSRKAVVMSVVAMHSFTCLLRCFLSLKLQYIQRTKGAMKISSANPLFICLLTWEPFLTLGSSSNQIWIVQVNHINH